MYTINEIKTQYPELQPHPANRFTAIKYDQERKENLKISLLREGVIRPIILVVKDEVFTILDGNERYNLLRDLHKANLLPKDFDSNIKVWDSVPENIELLATEMHLHYKDLSKSQRAAVAVKDLLPRLSDEAAVRMTLGRSAKLLEGQKGNATAIAAKMVGCSERMVCAAKKGIENIPETYDWIMAGKMTAVDAENLVAFPEDKKTAMIQQLRGSRSYGIAKQRFTNKKNINNDIKTVMEERQHQGDVIDMAEAISFARKPDSGIWVKGSGPIFDSAYTGNLTQECTPEEAKGLPLILTVHTFVRWEVLENLALVMSKNGYCEEPTVIAVKDKLYLIKPQKVELEYTVIPKAA